MATWEDIQIFTLQKMFAITGDTLVSNSSTLPYIKAMPQVANEALQLLSTAGKFITKSIEITQDSIEEMNLLENAEEMMNVYRHKNTDSEPYTATGAKSYYFEVDNPATVEISVGGVLATTVTNTAEGLFTEYKGNIANPSGLPVSIVFKGSYPYQYRNIALYDTTFATDSDVWDYTPEKRYELKTLATDFYRIKDVVYQGGYTETRYKKTPEYYLEGDSTLVLNGLQKGSWKISYFAYPQQITKTTLGSTTLTLDSEVVALLPLYMASQLYKDDDPAIATQWRNEFEVARDLLSTSNLAGTVEFYTSDVMGW